MSIQVGLQFWFFDFIFGFIIFFWVIFIIIMIVTVIWSIKHRSKLIKIKEIPNVSLINQNTYAKEIILVICPYCKHRNPHTNTKCENCGGQL
jgi:hypothetical protein